MADTTAPSTRRTTRRWVVLVLLVVLVGGAVLMPSRVPDNPDAADLTHLLALVRSNQPWNALLFLGVPLGLIILLAGTELTIRVDGGRTDPWAEPVNHLAGMLVGPFMVALAAHLVTVEAVHHRGHAVVHPIDVVSLVTYLLLALPCAVITLAELRLVGRDAVASRRIRSVAIASGLVLSLMPLLLAVLSV